MRDTGYWPKRFLEELETYNVEQGIGLSSLGSPSFFYQSPQARIYIDPYMGPTPPEAETLYPSVFRTTAVPIYPPDISKADAVISTHEHTDHCHEPTLLAFQRNTPAVFIAPETSSARMLEGGISRERILTLVPGQETSVKDVQIRVFPSHDPDAPGAVTYLLTSQGVRLFVSGDTRDGPTLQMIGDEFAIDLALLAFGSERLYMTYDQMLQAARRLKPKVLLPFHWEVWRGETGDVLGLGKAIGANPVPFEVRLLQIGDRFLYAADARARA